MMKMIKLIVLAVLICNRCHSFINEEEKFYIKERSYVSNPEMYHRYVDEKICRRCYRLLPNYVQDFYRAQLNCGEE